MQTRLVAERRGKLNLLDAIGKLLELADQPNHDCAAAD
jgi:hypothetical protein